MGVSFTFRSSKSSWSSVQFRWKEKERLEYLLIWKYVVWFMWRSQNARFFLGKETFVLQLVDMVKFTSWKWFLGKHYSHACSLYESGHEPTFCWHC